MMKHSWAVIETDYLKNPIFVPPNRTNGAEDGDSVLVSIKKRPDGKLYARVDLVLAKAAPSAAPLQPSSSQYPTPPPAQLAQASYESSFSQPPSTFPYQKPQSSPYAHPSAANLSVSSSLKPPMPIWTPQSSLIPESQQVHQYKHPQASNHTSPAPSRQVSSASSSVSLPSSNPAFAAPVASSYSPPSVSYAAPSPKSPLGQFSNPVSSQTAQHSSTAPKTASVGFQAVLAKENPLIEGVLMMDSPTIAFVIANEFEKVIHIPKDFLSGATQGEIVRVHIIPAKSTPDHLVGAILYAIGMHPSMTNDLPMENVTQSTANFYPDLDNWNKLEHASILSPSDSSSRISSTTQTSSQMTLTIPGSSSSASSSSSSASLSSSYVNAPPKSSSHTRKVSDGPSNGQSLSSTQPSPQLMAQLKHQFQTRIKQHPPTMSYSEFTVSLDAFGEIEQLSRGIFDIAQRRQIRSSASPDALTLDDWSAFIGSLLFGDEMTQLRGAFSLLDLSQLGVITKDALRVHTELVFRVMLSLMLPVYLANPSDMTEYFWSLLDVGRVGQVNFEQYAESMHKNRNAVLGLGLAQMPMVPLAPLPLRGVPIFPGHPSWPLVIQMMSGLSRASLAVREEDATNITTQSFRHFNKFELHTVLKVNHKLTFTDFAPGVFKRLRAMRGIDDAQYLCSLGVEQLLANFLLGRLTSFVKEGSTGKSGQFFFTSHDGRFLIKTIARHERNTLYKMLSSYLNHLQTYPNSLLVPIYGLHDIDQLSIIVMGNVFNSPYTMDSAWDLKGSVVGRSSPHSFIKKDLDFDRGFLFGAQANSEFSRQIRLDALFLKSMNIVDYSLLVGYHTLTTEELELFEHRELPANAHPYFDRGLRSYDAKGVLKNEVWFMGIIDILVQFGVLKKAENFVKSLVHDPNSISIIPPEQYCERFSNSLVSFIK